MEVAAGLEGRRTLGGWGAKRVLVGAGSWEGWVGLPMIKEVTMSVKSMFSGNEGLGGWEDQRFFSLAPWAQRCPCSLLSSSSPLLHPGCSGTLFSLIWSFRNLWPRNSITPCSQPPSPLRSPSHIPAAPPALPAAWALLSCRALLSSPPPHALWHPGTSPRSVCTDFPTFLSSSLPQCPQGRGSRT